VSEHGLSVTHVDASASADASQPVFYFDLGSPECYLAAERVMAELPVVPEWVPIEAAGLSSSAGDAAVRRAAVEARAQAQHVQPLRWPATWPQEDTRVAMVGATYAKQIGRAVAFSLAAFRQAYAAGHDLGDPDTVMLAAAACEMHPAAIDKGAGRDSIRRRLHEATDAAGAAGVLEVPAIQVGDRIFHGDRELEAAAAVLA